MVKQVQDAKISVKLDVEGAQKQAKDLSRSIRQNRIDLGEAQKDSKEVSKKVAGKGTREKHWYSSDKTGYAGVKDRAGKIRGKAVQFGYRGVRQAPDITLTALRLEAAAIEKIPYFGGPLSEAFKAAAPYAGMGGDIVAGMLTEYSEGGFENGEDSTTWRKKLADMIDKINLLEGQIRYTNQKTAGLEQVLQGGGAMGRAFLVQGEQSQYASEGQYGAGGQMKGEEKDLWLKVLEAEYDIGYSTRQLEEYKMKYTRRFLSRNFKDFMVRILKPT